MSLKDRKVNVSFFEKDISDKNIYKYVKNADILIHLAAITDAESSIKIKDQVDYINFKVFKKIVKLCPLFTIFIEQ